MRYLIDGHNLMHAVGEQGHAPTPARDTLCKVVARWAKRNGTDVTVVFDGFAPKAGAGKQLAQPGITVLFSRSTSADSLIEAIAYHGGEALKSKLEYFRQPIEDRLALIDFLKTLRGPAAAPGTQN